MDRFVLVVTGRADRQQIGSLRQALNSKGRSAVICDIVREARPYHEVATEFDRFISRNYRNANPRLVVLLGDRIEALAVASVATWHKIPIAHLHGGEATFGSFDNQTRDAITKLSHIHFVAANQFKSRLLKLGEDAHRIFVVGAIGLDLVKQYGSGPRNPANYFLITYHPATLGTTNVEPLLTALHRPAFLQYAKIWTKPNIDPGSSAIMAAIKNERIAEFGAGQYLAIGRNAALIIGNSSSGIIEAPSLEVPSVDIGSRQEGRLRGPSVFHAEETADDIEAAISAALSYNGAYTNPYGTFGASDAIADILANLESVDMVKKFTYDGEL